MMNIMQVGAHKAVIRFDAEIEMFRGEFVGLNGSADFLSNTVTGLKHEGEVSLQAFLDICSAKGLDPVRSFSGKLLVRIPEELHARAVEAAAADNLSLNAYIQQAIEAKVEATEDLG